MATDAQIKANQANALKSTGPRTGQGKDKVAQNAVKHGLRGEQVVIEGEDVGAFECYREAMLAELNPVGPVECTLAERVVGLAWRLRRVEQMQAEVFDTLLAKDLKGSPVRELTRSVLPKAIRKELDHPEHGETALGRVVVRDFSNHRVLDRLGLYERRIERSFYKAMRELERLRAMREFESFPRDSEITRGLRTHPTIAQEKSEIRSTKSETNTNDRNSNDKNMDQHRVGCASHTACHSNGNIPLGSVCGAHPTEPVDRSVPDLNEQSQFSRDEAQSDLQLNHKGLPEKELHTEEMTTVQS